MRQEIGDWADVAADLDDVRAVADEMRSKHLADFRGRPRKVRQAIFDAGGSGNGLQHASRSNEVWSAARECVVSCRRAPYNSAMMDVTRSEPATNGHDDMFDLTRGIAAYCGSQLVANLARVIGKHPQAEIANAFNHKQVACKQWARDMLYANCGGRFGAIWVLGGWYGVLPAMLFDDSRFDIGTIRSIDVDPGVGAVAATLNRHGGERFEAVTADMYGLDYAAGTPDLVVNTSCEHIADVPGWLAMMPKGTRVLLQSNDYFSEPTHINCVHSVDEFRTMAGLAHIDYAGELPMKKYKRFMLIGTT